MGAGGGGGGGGGYDEWLDLPYNSKFKSLHWSADTNGWFTVFRLILPYIYLARHYLHKNPMKIKSLVFGVFTNIDKQTEERTQPKT